MTLFIGLPLATFPTVYPNSHPYAGNGHLCRSCGSPAELTPEE